MAEMLESVGAGITALIGTMTTKREGEAMVPLAWLILGVILLAVELRHLAFYALFAAAGCFAAALTAVFVPGAIPLQVVVAAGVAALGIVAIRPMMSRRFHVHPNTGPLGKGVAGTLVGEEVLTLDEVGDIHHVGHVRLAGERWLASSGSGATIPEGTKVLVTAVEGTTLVVWPVDTPHELPRHDPGPDDGPEPASDWTQKEQP
jgi:membrane protein implicated in regulation of membrane protease activity